MKSKKTLIAVVIFAVGVLIGWLLLGRLPGDGHENTTHEYAGTAPQIWTCSMHPQIRQDKPGKCPLCLMDLIPLRTADAPEEGQPVDPDAVMLSKEAAALANVQTIVAGRSNPVKELHLYGTIQPNERLLRSQVSHVSGRIEKLSVNFTGETVREGQVIASVYSPDLLNAQRELLEAAKLQGLQPALLAAAREKLRLWKLTGRQIEEIERTGEVSPLVNIVADATGIVVAKRVEQGDYINQGGVLFDLADLSSVWAVFEAYESDLSYLKVGDELEYALQTLPGKTFAGKIAFIDPALDKTTRTVKVRVETANPRLELKPEMYAGAVVKASLREYAGEIVIPKTAVLWTGKRSIVYVKQSGTDSPVFMLRTVELGPSLGDGYVALSGIGEGEEIVTGGAFAIDASAQLEGKRSMMNNDNAPEHALITVQGLCDMCKDRIEKAAKGVQGVSSASWDAASKQLHLHFDPGKTSAEAVSQALARAGHDAGRYKADDKVYDALPDCCKYRD